jgi:multiple sugar transport system ATP-binding protein
MAGIELKDVVKRYGSAEAVRKMNLQIPDGSFVVLVGPSGCGKTTTLRMIAGLETVTEGTIRLSGRDVTNLEPKDRDVAMVFQNYALYPHMSIYDNIAFGLRARKLPKGEIDERVRRAATM